MKQIFKSILDLIFPVLCIKCGKEGSYLCHECANQIKRYEHSFCPECRVKTKIGEYCEKCKQDILLSGILLDYDFDDKILLNAVHLFKYEFVRELKKPLAKLLPRKKITEVADKNSIIISVPTHKSKLNSRGYNQSELLAKELALDLKIEFRSDILTKSKKTHSQMSLKREDRIDNLKNAFSLKNNAPIRGKTVFIVDDICTTGSTIKECAKILSKHQPKQIWGVVIARGK